MEFLKKIRLFTIESSIAFAGFRAELCFVPFSWAKPQIAYARMFTTEKRLPSAKIGPLHFWMMEYDNIELRIEANFSGYFHETVFSKIYEDSFVWPEYKEK